MNEQSQNIFDKAQQYYSKNPPEIAKSRKRELAVRALMLVIDTAPFLTPSQKDQLKLLTPIHPVPVLESVRKNLIQQGYIFLQLNPNFQDKMQVWLKEIED